MTDPKTYIAIPSGPPKKYALFYMFAALENLDYPNKEVHWCLTRYDGHGDERGFTTKFFDLLDASDLQPIYVKEIPLTKKQTETPYLPVLFNLQYLRGDFLDGDCDYFLLLGGDNPPPRNTIQRLMSHDVDVACGLIHQRPGRGLGGAVVPMVYYPAWNLDEVPRDLPWEIREEFEKAFLNSMLFIPAHFDPYFSKKKKLRRFAAGSGCTLIRREVLENIGFSLPLAAYHSEDLNFFMKCMFYGYSTLLDMKLRVPHFDDDGDAF